MAALAIAAAAFVLFLGELLLVTAAFRPCTYAAMLILTLRARTQRGGPIWTAN